jgi:hypothetical protein
MLPCLCGSCFDTLSGANITCPIVLKNTGQLTLTAIKAVTATPLATDCDTTAELAPGATHACTLTATAIQDNYDVSNMQLSVTAEAGHKGSSAQVLGGTLSYASTISLNNSASMDVVVVADGTVAKAGGPALEMLPVQDAEPFRGMWGRAV